MTCNICGTGFKGEDILIYGCISCKNGYASRTSEVPQLVSPYVPNWLRQKLIIRHQIPLERSERAVRQRRVGTSYVDTISPVNYI